MSVIVMSRLDQWSSLTNRYTSETNLD